MKGQGLMAGRPGWVEWMEEAVGLQAWLWEGLHPALKTTFTRNQRNEFDDYSKTELV